MNSILFCSKTLTVVLILASAAVDLHSRDLMLDPATDDPARPWCFLDKSTTVIGVPFMPDVTQVTFDGALYNLQQEGRITEEVALKNADSPNNLRLKLSN